MNFLDLLAAKGAEWYAPFQTLLTRLSSLTDALEAALFGVGATSSTNLTPATGNQAFTLNSAKSLKAGMYRAESAAAPATKYMIGELAADTAASTALTLNVQIAAGAAAADWVIVPLGRLLAAAGPNSAKSAAYTLTKADREGAILISGTTTITADTIAVLGEGFAVDLVNTGTGICTFARGGTDTVDGATSVQFAPGQAVRPKAVAATQWRVVGAKGYGAASWKLPDLWALGAF